jgi:hypothetical protein
MMSRRLISTLVATALIVPALLALTTTPASATTFSNPGSIALNNPTETLADATPYPSSITVSGLTGTVSTVAVTLSNVTYSYSQDIDALLVGPGGQSLILVANLGPSTGPSVAANDSTVTFSDSGTLPTANTPWGSSSTFKPVNFPGFNETWGSPAPAGPYGDPGTSGAGATLTSQFGGTSPNGTWSLYAITTSAGDGTGAIADGWSINVSTASAAATTTAVASNNNPSFTSAPANSVTFTATVEQSSNAAAVSEGTVNFTAGGTTIAGCGAVAVAAGQATCTTSFTAEGIDAIEAQFSGDSNFGPSSASLSQQVNDHTTVTGNSYCNTGSIALNNPPDTLADATPYPSDVFVSGLGGTLSQVSVTLSGVTYRYSQDIDALLVGPAGQSLILVANLGPSTGGNVAASDSTVTFSDSGTLPTATTPWGSSSTFKPVNFGGFNETWGAPAPAGPYGDPGTLGTGATLGSQFNGGSPNGTWSLYLITTSAGDGTGTVAGGWCVGLTTSAAAATTTTLASDNNPSLTTAPGNSVDFTATVQQTTDLSNVSEGTVAFTAGGSTIAGCGAVPVSVGQAVCTTSFTAEGSDEIVAEYSGDANFGSSNASLSQQVNDHTTVTGTNYCNTGSIALNNPPDTVADATPYPSNVFVSGLSGNLTHVSATLNGVTYPYSQDIDALLVGPGGQNLILVADLGPNSGAGAPLSEATVTFDDNGTLPAQNTPWQGGSSSTFKPVNFGGFNETWGPPAPAGPYGDPGTLGTGATLGSQFDGTSPNGTWSLYLITTAAGDGTGAVAGGWCLGVTTPSPPVLTESFGAPSVNVGGTTSLSFTVENPNAAASLSGVGFTDALPAGLVVATPTGLTGSCDDGTITAVAGTGSLSLSGATLAASSTCSFSVNVTATVVGNKVNTTSAVTSVEGGDGAPATASLLVNGEPPGISSVDGATFFVGQSNSFTVQTTGVPTPAISETGTLPGGVSFVDNGDGTATISGDPSPGTGGSYPITITADNGVDPPATQDFTLVVEQAPMITSPGIAAFADGQAGTYTITTTGSPAPSIVETGKLPNGLTFADNGDGTATIAGLTTSMPRTVHLTITASNGAGTTTAPLALSVVADVPGETLSVTCRPHFRDIRLAVATLEAVGGGTMDLQPGCTSHVGSGPGTGLFYTTANGSDAIPPVTVPITINGNGDVVALAKGASAMRLIEVESSGSLTLNDVTLRGGDDESSFGGGAVFNAGTLNLTDVTILRNRSSYAGDDLLNDGTMTISGGTVTDDVEEITAAVVSFGDLDVSGTAFTHDGEGAIEQFGGSVSVTDATFSFDVQEVGAAIFTDTASAFVTDSTFTDNTSLFGAAVAAADGTTVLVDDTVVHNYDYLGGALGADGSTLDVTDSTVADNLNAGDEFPGSAVTSIDGATVNLAGDVLATKYADPLGECGTDGASSIVDGGYNFSDDSSCGFTQSTSQVVSSLRHDFGTLANHGGPVETVPEQAGSPTIDVVPSTATDVNGLELCAGTDARGVARPQTGCDAGSFQTVSTTTTIGLSKPTIPDGSPEVLTATVTPSSSLSQPTTVVDFYRTKNGHAVLIGSADLNGSDPDEATLTTSSLPLGTYTVTAVFVAANGFLSSTATAVSITVS